MPETGWGDPRLAALPPAKRALAERLLAARQRRAAPIPRRAQAGEPGPLTYQQERVWPREHAASSEHSAVPLALRFEGELDGAALAEAWRRLGRRHESLRTVFTVVDGCVRQAPSGPELAMERVDVPVRDPADAVAEAERQAAADASAPFDLRRGPLARARLLRFAPDHHALLLNLHHLVIDAWSTRVVLGELWSLYEALVGGGADPLPEVALQYLDYAAWQRAGAGSGLFDADVEHWRSVLNGVPPRLRLPHGGATPPPPPPLGILDLRLSDGTAARLHQLATAAGASLFMVLAAAFAATLASVAGQDEVVVGTPVAARTRAELEGVVGFLVNLVPLRVALEPDERRLDDLAGGAFGRLLSRVRRAATAAFSHEDAPLDLVLERLGIRPEPGHAPLFQAAVVLQNVAAPAAGGAGTAVSVLQRPDRPALLPFLPFYSPAGASFDVAMQLTRLPGGLVGNLEYCAARVGPDTAAEVRARFGDLVEAVGRQVLA